MDHLGLNFMIISIYKNLQYNTSCHNTKSFKNLYFLCTVELRNLLLKNLNKNLKNKLELYLFNK
jgi:hypothetical protein